MPKPPLPEHLDEFLKDANPSVIGTLDPDGAPHTAATWYLWEGGRVLVNMDATRKRLEYLRQDARVSLTVLGRENWYKQVTLRGRVAEIADDPDFEGIDRLSTHYMGGESVDAFEIGNRKSTRLNSSHPSISYAVFCLKKKRTISTYV